MVGAMLYVAVATVGVQVGWEPNDRGEMEYIIQIEPEMLQAWLASGEKILYSDIRPELRDVRAFRLQIGTGKVPRAELPTPPPTTAVETSAKKPPTPDTVETSAKEPTTTESRRSGPDSGASDREQTQPTTNPSKATASPWSLDGQQAVYQEPVEPSAVPPVPPSSEPSSNSTSAAVDKYRMPMMLTGCAAAGLLAALVYLGWAHLGVRRRYQTLLTEHLALLARVAKPA